MSARARFLGILLIGLAVIWIALGARSCFGQHQVDAHVQQADQHHQNAAIEAGQGAAYDKQEKARKAEVKGLREETARVHAETARARAEVERVRKTLPRHDAPAGSAVDAPGTVPAAVDLASMVASQNLLIQAQAAENAAQAREIVGLRSENQILTLARDAWRSSAQASAAEAVQLRAALAAKDGLIKAAYLKGLRDGLLIGVPAGAGGGGYLTWRAMR